MEMMLGLLFGAGPMKHKDECLQRGSKFPVIDEMGLMSSLSAMDQRRLQSLLLK